MSVQLILALQRGKTLPEISSASCLNQAIHKGAHFPSKQSYILLAALGIPSNSIHRVTLKLANDILGGQALSSRLFHKIREKNGLAYSTHSGYIPLKATGPFFVILSTRHNMASKSLAEARKTLKEYINQGPTELELINAKRHLTQKLPFLYASNAKISRLLSELAFYNLPLNYLDTYIQRINAITLEDIRNMLYTLFHRQAWATIQVGPDQQSS